MLTGGSVKLCRFQHRLVRRLLGGKCSIAVSLPGNRLITLLIRVKYGFVSADVSEQKVGPGASLDLFQECGGVLRRRAPSVTVACAVGPGVCNNLTTHLGHIPCTIGVANLNATFRGGNVLHGLIIFLCGVTLGGTGIIFFRGSNGVSVFAGRGVVGPGRTFLLGNTNMGLARCSILPCPGSGSTVQFLFVKHIVHRGNVSRLFRIVRQLYTRKRGYLLSMINPCRSSCRRGVGAFYSRN